MARAISREQWMLATALAGAVNTCNAPFCAMPITEQEAVNRDPGTIDAVAAELARQSSRMAIEDAIDVLEQALVHCTE